MKTHNYFAVRAPSRHKSEFVVLLLVLVLVLVLVFVLVLVLELLLLLLLLLERAQMTEPIFDFERLDVYRLAIDRCV